MEIKEKTEDTLAVAQGWVGNEGEATIEISRRLEIETEEAAMDSDGKPQNTNGSEWICALLLRVLPGTAFLQCNLIQFSQIKMNLCLFPQSISHRPVRGMVLKDVHYSLVCGDRELAVI